MKYTIIILLQIFFAGALLAQTEEEKVFKMVEQEAQYKGGFSAFSTYIAENIQYPDQAIKDEVSGVVYVSFVVQKDGSIKKAEILRGISKECDAEALRIISDMPNWEPAKSKDEAVNSKVTLPIKFKL